MWQMHLLKNWRASFYAAKKKCHIRTFVCTIHHRKFATYSEAGSGFFGFVSTVHSHFWRIGKRVFNMAFADIFVTENLPQKICSCGLGFSYPFLSHVQLSSLATFLVFLKNWPCSFYPWTSSLRSFFLLPLLELARTFLYTSSLAYLAAIRSLSLLSATYFASSNSVWTTQSSTAISPRRPIFLGRYNRATLSLEWIAT